MDSVDGHWYHAPELLLRVNDIASSVDMWSAGCVVAEMLIGRPLFRGQRPPLHYCRQHFSRHANHSSFGGIIPHFRRFSAIPRGICEIPLFHSIHLSRRNLVFSYINL